MEVEFFIPKVLLSVAFIRIHLLPIFRNEFLNTAKLKRGMCEKLLSYPCMLSIHVVCCYSMENCMEKCISMCFALMII